MAKIDPYKFPLALLAWCKEKNTTQYQIAKKIGIPCENLYVYTRRKEVPNIPSLARAAEIADALGITIDQLAQGPNGEGLRDE